MDSLFVYGTLVPGGSNAHLLERIGGSWRRGTVRGRMDPEGWGRTGGYPALVLGGEGGKVDGFVFTSEGLADRWEGLDFFEGEAYERVVTTVELEDGSAVEAFVYVLGRG